MKPEAIPIDGMELQDYTLAKSAIPGKLSGVWNSEEFFSSQTIWSNCSFSIAHQESEQAYIVRH